MNRRERLGRGCGGDEKGWEGGGKGPRGEMMEVESGVFYFV